MIFIKVFIGVGHGGVDSGAVCNGLVEKDINLNIALFMKKYLESFGVSVYVSRETDENDTVNDEIKKANKLNCDIALDIHTNAGGGKGFEVFHQTNKYKQKSSELAKLIEEEVLKIGQNSRGLKTKVSKNGDDYFGFLRCVDTPAVILECAFIDNLKDVEFIKDKALQEKFAKAYSDGVLKYFKVTKECDNVELTNICGESVASIEQMRAFLKSKNEGYFDVFGDLPKLYFDEGKIEGVRGDIAFAQACLETGYFKFGNDVLPEQNNFCGLGATGNGAKGCSFESPYWGVMAHVQHLKAYADNEECYQKIIDPRFKFVERGVAPHVEWLGIKENPKGKGWATDKGYGGKILGVLDGVLKTKIDNDNFNVGSKMSCEEKIVEIEKILKM